MRNVGCRLVPPRTDLESEFASRKCPDHLAATADRVAGPDRRRHARPESAPPTGFGDLRHSYLHLLAGGGESNGVMRWRTRMGRSSATRSCLREETGREFLVDPGARRAAGSARALENILVRRWSRGSAVGARAVPAGSECAGRRAGLHQVRLLCRYTHLAGSCRTVACPRVCRCAHSARRTLRPGSASEPNASVRRSAGPGRMDRRRPRRTPQAALVRSQRFRWPSTTKFGRFPLDEGPRWQRVRPRAWTGEVYVLAVAPRAGTGLGSALTVAGLKCLQGWGCMT